MAGKSEAAPAAAPKSFFDQSKEALKELPAGITRPSVKSVYDSPEGVIGSLASGYLEGAAGPIGTAIAKEAMGSAEDLRGVQETNPLAHEGTKLLTTVALAASGAGLPGAIGRVGAGAGALARSSAVARSAITFGTESALYGVSNHFSDAILNDHPVRGQELASSVIRDFGIGALFGAATGVVGKGLSALRSKAGGSLEDMGAKRFAEAAGYNKHVSDSMKAARGGESGYYKGIRETWDDAEKQLGKKLRSLDDIVAANQKGQEHWGSKVRSLLDDAEKARPAMVDTERLIGHVEQAAAKLKADPTAGALQARLEGMATRMREQFTTVGADGAAALRPVKLSEVKDLSTAFREKFLRTDASSATPIGQVAKSIRGEFEGEIKRALETVGSKDLVKQYTHAKGMYQNYMWLDDALENGINKATHAAMGPREMAAMVAGAASGGIGMATAGAIGSKLLKTPTANLIIGDTMRRAASLDAMSMVNQKASQAVRAGVEQFISDKPAPKARMKEPVRYTPEQMRNVLDTVHKATPDTLMNSIEGTVSRKVPHDVAPSLFMETTMTLNKAAAYLSATAPLPLVKSVSLTPQLEKNRYSSLQTHLWMERVNGIEDPYSILSDMNRGKLSHAKVDAVKAVHPDVYATIRDTVSDYIAELEKPLPYGKTVQVSTLFGFPADDTLTPDFVAIMQQSAQPEQEPQQRSQGRPSAITDKLSDQYATPGDTIGVGL